MSSLHGTWSTLLRALAVMLSAALLVPTSGWILRADTAPAAPGEPATVTADPLPTAQINGVVWSQVVVGDVVYAAGNFTKARPAGSPAGSNEVVRTHLLAFDIRTGALIEGFAPSINAQVLTIAKSPDESRIYIGGQFTSVNGQPRTRLAAFNTSDGSLVGSFRPNANSTVRSLTSTDSVLYVGGDLTVLAGQLRAYFGGVRTTDGSAVPAFLPQPDAAVTALTMSTSGSKVVVGGRFESIGGADAYGMAAVDASSGAQVSWPIKDVIRNAGDTSTITSLSSDGDSVYGTGYVFPIAGGGGNFEGAFRADGETGEVIWVADCHGDSYGVYAQGDVVYAASHAHYCGNTPDGFLENNPRDFYRANAFTKDARGVSVYNAAYGYPSFDGQPAPAMLHWYPDFQAGTFTGQDQAGWTVTATGDYVVYGGEFRAINGQVQQGLVRFAKSTSATNNTPPLAGPSLTPAAVSVATGTVDVGWRATWDYDNKALSYVLRRTDPDGSTTSLPATVASSWPGVKPVLKHRDTGLAEGETYRYQVTATDPTGQSVAGTQVAVTVSGAAQESAYGKAVLADDPEHWFRLDDGAGFTFVDSRAADHAVALTSLPAADTPVAGGGALALSGSSTDYAATGVPSNGPQTFSIEAWVRTTSTTGGRVVGFGDKPFDTSGTGETDRQLYLDEDGRAVFTVNPEQEVHALTSQPGYNDGTWHHLVGTVGADGMRLYVDGREQAADPAVTGALNIMGHWRIGTDSLRNLPNEPVTASLTGAVDEVAVYHRQLDAAQVAAHFSASGREPGGNRPPFASFTATVTDFEVAVDAAASSDAEGPIAAFEWDFGDGTTATGVTASHAYGAAGVYPITLEVTDSDGAVSTSTRDIEVGDVANIDPTAALRSSVLGGFVVVDGSAATDPDGTVASYAWDFGDGGVAEEARAAHQYSAAGDYEVTLTVTDDEGGTGTVTEMVTVTEPTAPFAADAFLRFSGSRWGDADLGGGWSRIGSSRNFTIDGDAGRMRLLNPGTSIASYLTEVSALDQDVAMTYSTDKLGNGGGFIMNLIARGDVADGYRAKVRTAADGSVTLQLVRVVGSAQSVLASTAVPGLTVTPGMPLRVRLQATGSGPTQLAAKVWDPTGPEPAAWAVQATDGTASLQQPGGLGLLAYVSATATNAPITVSVDDIVAFGEGAAPPPPNQGPTASFDTAVDGLTVSVDGSGSEDPDGSIAEYVWDFGDAAVGSGATASHTYAAAGSYAITLTVTDNEGATATTTSSVTVAEAPPPPPPPAAGVVAADAFGRSVAAGWGAADVGGSWSLGGGSQNFAVDGSAGLLTVPAAGRSVAAYLDGVSAIDQDLVFTFAPQTVADGGGTYLNVAVRGDASNAYRAKLLVRADGSVRVQLVRVVDGGQSVLATAEVPGLTVSAGTPLRVRVQALGSGPTQLAAKVWDAAGSEPAGWAVQASDATAALQDAGGLGLFVYVSGSATNTPITARIDDLEAAG